MSVDESSVRASPPMQVVVRSLAVLTCLADNRQGLTLQQLHHLLDIPLGSMHRILATLEHERFVSRSTRTKRYILGANATNLVPSQSYESFLVPPPAPVIEAARLTGETIFLTQIIDSRVVCVSLVEARHRLRLFVKIGQEMPLHAAASARVVLAYRDPLVVEVLLAAYPREPFTSGTPREINQLIDHLAQVRERGYDVCNSELDDDVWAIAAPVFDASGRVELGVTLAAAWTRMEDPARRAEVTRIVLTAAKKLSTERGYTGANEIGETDVRELTSRFADSSDGHPPHSEQHRGREW
jgi:DNA-binding IclR family transcriptional regulator